ncbi:MAG: hypothetical protein JRJ29_00335 [Deltaproteobacteria bacterium]|nr:hypothetical protein [Deltaproteobacteria bacterium]MBW2081614.1 hypothetical protein [Deltaproteobacteria bacterium]
MVLTSVVLDAYADFDSYAKAVRKTKFKGKICGSGLLMSNITQAEEWRYHFCTDFFTKTKEKDIVVRHFRKNHYDKEVFCIVYKWKKGWELAGKHQIGACPYCEYKRIDKERMDEEYDVC